MSRRLRMPRDHDDVGGHGGQARARLFTGGRPGAGHRARGRRSRRTGRPGPPAGHRRQVGRRPHSGLQAPDDSTGGTPGRFSRIASQAIVWRRGSRRRGDAPPWGPAVPACQYEQSSTRVATARPHRTHARTHARTRGSGRFGRPAPHAREVRAVPAAAPRQPSHRSVRRTAPRASLGAITTVPRGPQEREITGAYMPAGLHLNGADLGPWPPRRPEGVRVHRVRSRAR